MIFIIPWRVDVPEDRWPFLNWLIVLGIMAAFFFEFRSLRQQRAQLPEKMKEYSRYSVEDMAKEFEVSKDELKEFKRLADREITKIKFNTPLVVNTRGMKQGLIKKAILERYFVWEKVRPFVFDGSSIEGLLGHIWLHGGFIHLLGNLLFLWVFGNAVCAKIGNLRYLSLYFGFGLIAAMAHLLFMGGPMIGASGAIMGVVGMYLVFFPVNDITCYFILIYRPYAFTVSSYWMVLMWLGYNLLGAFSSVGSSSGGGTAYFAHLGGFFCGFVLAVFLLKKKWIHMERYEKSLLQLAQDRKEPEKGLYGANHGMYPYDLEMEKIAEEKRRTEWEDGKDKVVEVEPKLVEADVAVDDFIRFVCVCGKRIKVPMKYGGKSGKCPRCKAKVNVPEA